jgi:type I restriction enzyme S subunit
VTWTTDGAYAGTVFFRTGKFNCTNVCGTLKEKVEQDLDLRFLSYLLSSVAKNHVSYVGNPKLMNGVMAKISLQLPSNKKEQQKIAEIISKINKTIEQMEALIAKYQHIKTGLMQDLLTKGIDEHGNIRSEKTHEFKDSPLGRIPKEWDCLTIDSISERLRSGVTPKGGSSVYQKEGIMLIRSQNVYPYGFKLEDVAFISKEINNRMIGSELKVFDVLLNITGASIGRSTFVPHDFPRANVNQHVCSIRLKEPSIEKSTFLSSYLNSIYGQNQIMQNNAGSNREGINYTQIKGIRIPYFNNDKEFTELNKFVFKSSKKIEMDQIKLNKLQKLKKGLMQDLLSGKKRVTTLLK